PPRRPRLVDLLELPELLGGGLLDVLRLLLLAALAVDPIPPVPYPPRRFFEPRALGDVSRVSGLVPLAAGRALRDELAPAARVQSHAPRLGLDLDDGRH